MIKKLIIVSIITIVCPILAFSQLNRTIHDQAKDKDILYGFCTRDAIENNDGDWFKSEYEAYEVKTSVFNFDLPEKFDSVYVFMGTWCDDSRREIPRFCKIFDLEYFRGIPIIYICVNSAKTVDVVDVDEYYVQFIPTIIFYKKGDELCRIIEQPRTESLESDIMDLMERMQ